MTETLDPLMQHHGTGARTLVWTHNTHIGDARFTDMVGGGMVNLRQLVRTRHEPEDVVLVGFGSHQGSVIAGREWEAPTVLPRRYDAFLYLDTTQALHPLRDVPARSQADVPETYPSGV